MCTKPSEPTPATTADVDEQQFDLDEIDDICGGESGIAHAAGPMQSEYRSSFKRPAAAPKNKKKVLKRPARKVDTSLMAKLKRAYSRGYHAERNRLKKVAGCSEEQANRLARLAGQKTREAAQ